MPRQDPGTRTPISRPYALEEHNSGWPHQFAQIADTLQSLLGEEIVRIEHVGSTSIQGMPSKPQIDVLIVVRRLDAIANHYRGVLVAHGYTSRGDYTHRGEEYFTMDSSAGVREVSVHILPSGNQWASDLLVFRDYLRSHPNELAYYASIKREMHHQHPSDYSSYYVGKLQILLEIMGRASEWRSGIA